MDPLPPAQSAESIQWMIAALASVLALVGIFVGAYLTHRYDRGRKQLDFIEKQLREFYSPLVGIRMRIRAHGDTRVHVQNAAGAAWRELCDEARDRGGPAALQELEQRRWPAFRSVTAYDNEQFRNTLLPEYDVMLQIFRDNYMLAEASTRQQLPALVEYVELWHRHFDGTVPPEAIVRLTVREDTLRPLYEDLDRTFEALRAKLASGNPK